MFRNEDRKIKMDRKCNETHKQAHVHKKIQAAENFSGREA